MSRLSHTFNICTVTGDLRTVEVFRTDPQGTGQDYSGPNAMGVTKTVVNGELNAVKDEPSVLFDDGSKQYHLNGRLHRENGPAVITAEGEGFWYFDGVRVGTENDPDFSEKWERTVRYNSFVNPRIAEMQREEALQDNYDNWQ